MFQNAPPRGFVRKTSVAKIHVALVGDKELSLSNFSPGMRKRRLHARCKLRGKLHAQATQEKDDPRMSSVSGSRTCYCAPYRYEAGAFSYFSSSTSSKDRYPGMSPARSTRPMSCVKRYRRLFTGLDGQTTLWRRLKGVPVVWYAEGYDASRRSGR